MPALRAGIGQCFQLLSAGQLAACRPKLTLFGAALGFAAMHKATTVASSPSYTCAVGICIAAVARALCRRCLHCPSMQDLLTSALTAAFWVGIIKIVWIDMLLSGDNAVVIALAARSLPPEQQRKAILMGAGFAIVLRVVLTFVAAKLMQLPFLELAGGILLLWIGVGLLKGESADDAADADKKGSGSMAAAVRTIVLADLVMSLDNVIAVAATAGGDFVLLMFGLAVSIPLMIFGSTIMIKLMTRFPWIVPAGAALIGWVAGETIAGDGSLEHVVAQFPALKYIAGAIGAALVLAVGTYMKKRNEAAAAATGSVKAVAAPHASKS